LKPTIFASVPRLWNRLYDKVNATIRDEGGLKQKLFNMGFSSKQDGLKAGGPPTSGFWDALIFSKLKARLGGRVRLMITGAAPLSEEVYRFLQIAFCVPVLQGYGLTETAAALSLTRPDDFSTGHVGSPILSVEVRLADVPEMNYSSKNDPPTGEVCVRGNNVFKGYYKNEAQTNADVKDGWFHTGDVGRWNPNGTLSIIDRKKNIFKLAQGEYVAAEHVEAQYIKVMLFLFACLFLLLVLIRPGAVHLRAAVLHLRRLAQGRAGGHRGARQRGVAKVGKGALCFVSHVSAAYPRCRMRATRATSRRCAPARRCASFCWPR
jgi:long-chain acyl-CoA synthetase